MSEHNHKPEPGKKQTASPEREAAIARFWNKYIGIIHDKGIKEPFDRGFVIRASHYIEAFPDKRLALHTSDDLSKYLNVLDRNGSWQGWRFLFATEDMGSISVPVSVLRQYAGRSDSALLLIPIFQ